MGKIKPSIFAVVDIGSQKIVCFIARISADGTIEVIGIGHTESTGIRAGIITDLHAAESAILNAIHAAEKMAELTIERVVINISGSKTKSHSLKVSMSLGSKEASQRDINMLMDQVYTQFDPELYEVIHCIPTDYVLDGEAGITDPRGMYGDILEAKTHIVTTTTTMLLNLTSCLGRCHLDVLACLSSPYAAGIACLSDDEQKLGTVIVDIGACHTSLGVFYGGNYIYCDNIMLGGAHITSDIAWGISTSSGNAERIKVKYGSLAKSSDYEYEKIDINQGDERKSANIGSQITRADLNNIIASRIDELFAQICKRLAESGLSQMAMGRLVFTGGGSQIAGLQHYASTTFGKHVRVAAPKQLMGVAESLRGPAYSAIHGMLYLMANHANEMMLQQKKGFTLADNNTVGRVMGWIKENF